jgi:alpha-L-fucosidase
MLIISLPAGSLLFATADTQPGLAHDVEATNLSDVLTGIDIYALNDFSKEVWDRIVKQLTGTAEDELQSENSDESVELLKSTDSGEYFSDQQIRESIAE